ncbi:MAG TPA: hypothetical protein VGT24_06305 [Candidatus Acidoferrales bacterium]|nr:hypothetical protein [Candidatus Acidoferrales bacterium]
MDYRRGVLKDFDITKDGSPGWDVLPGNYVAARVAVVLKTDRDQIAPIQPEIPCIFWVHDMMGQFRNVLTLTAVFDYLA